jgi:hypothetical protein
MRSGVIIEHQAFGHGVRGYAALRGAARDQRRCLMRGVLVLLLAMLAVPAMASAASPVEFHVVGILPHAAQIEDAVTTQFNTQVRLHWNVAPIFFGSAGIPVFMVGSSTIVAADCGYSGEATDGIVAGCHASLNRQTTGEPDVLVGPLVRSATMSHEIIETMIDPDTLGLEPCDPVENSYYMVDGELMQDFTFPNYFMSATSVGPWDWMHVIHDHQGVTFTPSINGRITSRSRRTSSGHGTGTDSGQG